MLGDTLEQIALAAAESILARGDRLAIDAVMPKPERGARGVATGTSPEHVLQTTEAAVAIETESERRAAGRFSRTVIVARTYASLTATIRRYGVRTR